jgi:hypothetical protein
MTDASASSAFTADEAQGQSLDIIVPQNLRDRHWQVFRETMRTGRTRYAAGDLAGRMIGIAAVMRDVTKRFEEMKALRKSAARAGQF